MTIQDISAGFAGIVADAAPGIVSVSSRHGRSSGFIWKPGLIVTVEEALGEESEFDVTSAGGEKQAAKLVGRDPSTDVALLRVVDATRAPVKLASSEVAAGQLAIAV